MPASSFFPRFFACCLAMLASFALAKGEATSSEHDQAIHVLNRITFGPKPGDVESVEKLGVRAFIDQQLHPETLDDSAVERDLAGFDLLQMSSSQLMTLFRDERKKAEERKRALTANPAAATPNPQAPMALLNDHRSVSVIAQLQQAKLVRTVESPRQLQEVLVDFWSNHFNIDVKKNADRVLKVVDDRDVIRPHIWGRFRDLLGASAKSPAMLIYLDNALNSAPRNIGPFEEKMRLAALQKMSLTAPEDETAMEPAQPKKPKKTGGINENYAREIMELHTLGVDGGYTQQDVQEVARCFTGWTIDRQAGTFVFRPRQHDNGAKTVLGHDIPAGGGMQDGETVLDLLCAHPATAHHLALQLCQRFVSDDPPAPLVDRIAAVFTRTGGDLRQVTEAILTSPEFLSPSDNDTKIKSPLEFAVSALRATGSSLVAQEPGHLGKLVTAMESAGTLGQPKAVERAHKRARQSLNWHIYELGEPLFACAPPTGYSEISKSWVGPGALIERLNFALALTGQKISDVLFDPQAILAGTDLDKPEAVLARSISVLLQDHVTAATKKVLEDTVVPKSGEGKTVNPSKLLALIIGSPEFQRK